MRYFFRYNNAKSVQRYNFCFKYTCTSDNRVCTYDNYMCKIVNFTSKNNGKYTQNKSNRDICRHTHHFASVLSYSAI